MNIKNNPLCTRVNILLLEMYFICRWQVNKWSPCSKSCGGGHRSRNVTCIQVINKFFDPVTKDPTLCSENQPQSQETCNHHHCYNHWHKGPWSDVSYSLSFVYLTFLLNFQCSSSCGNGTRTRNITCINAHQMEIEANNCSLLTKPEEEKNCTGKMCTYKWIVSEWSNVRFTIQYDAQIFV